MAQPTLVVDVRRLAGNIAAVRRALGPTKLALRVVTKSLPAPKLVEAVMTGGGPSQLMVFGGVMLDETLAHFPNADVLTGRPLPAVQVARPSSRDMDRRSDAAPLSERQLKAV